MSRPQRILSAPVLLIAVLAGVLLAMHLAEMPLRIPLNYNEGWMAFFSERAVQGGVLYPPPGGFISNNYPPLSFFLFGWAGALVGDQVVAGRIVSLVALAAVTGWVWLSARSLGAGRGAATAGALVFALFNLTWFHVYVGMADPQWLGQAVMLAGLPLLLRDGPVPLGHAALSALLMVAGGFIKHNLIALPLAVGLWLLLHDRRAFFAWGGAAAAGLGAGIAGVFAAFGRAAFVDVIGDHRRLMPEQWLDALAYFAPMAPLIALTAWWAWPRRAEPKARLIGLYAAIALPLAFLERLGEGINVNGYFETLVAVGIGTAAGLGAAPALLRGRTWSAAALAFAVAAPTILASPYFIGQAAQRLVQAPARASAWDRVIRAAAIAPGPVACETLSVCYWAGKGFELDFFNYGQDLRAGVSPDALSKLIDARRFAALVITRDAAFARGEGRLPHPIPERIEVAYAVRLAAPGDTVLMTPRP